MTIGITIHTYQRPDGRTPQFLIDTLISIANQTYQDFKIFVVGDKYDDNEEFENVLNYVNELKGKIIHKNLSYAKERDKYLGVNNVILWNCGGANALNEANNLAKQNGITKVCHIDHDDLWLPNHLELVVKAIKEKQNPAFIYTLSEFLSQPVFPNIEVDGQIIESYPSYASLIHSSIYMDLEQLPLEYRDVWEEENRVFPSDGDMWERVRVKCQNENLKSYVIRNVTCIHDKENH